MSRSALAWLAPVVALTLAACGGVSEADAECARLHQERAEISQPDVEETVEESLDETDRLLDIAEGMLKHECGPASDYEVTG